jgi:demethylmenaquinone methyltransferase/2-methoxy-6-polyprenyl-1,4-benzoquinol methylase
VFVTLELFAPKARALRMFHDAGLRVALPALGRAIAGESDAYAYLAESMREFVTRERYAEMLAEAGFASAKGEDLTFGMAGLVTGWRPDEEEDRRRNNGRERRPVRKTTALPSEGA